MSITVTPIKIVNFRLKCDQTKNLKRCSKSKDLNNIQSFGRTNFNFNYDWVKWSDVMAVRQNDLN
jgi:hypothetical protein